jgi:5'(3')-deoxyribonucleotidase
MNNGTTMTKPRVLIDVDGVLADFIGAVLPIVERITGGRYIHEHVTHFDFSASLGLTKEHAAAVKRKIGETAGFAISLQPLGGAIDGVRRLRSIADVYVVTSPWNSNATWTHEREAWLKRWFDIPHSHVIHTSAKYVCLGDVFVDDKTEAVDEWRAAHPQGVAVQWSTPHNRLDLWDGPSTNDWSHLIEIVGVAAANRDLDRLLGVRP